MFLGIEIGGTKLQMAIGAGDGTPFVEVRRAEIRPEDEAGGILRQIETIGRELVERHRPTAIGIGFGGPVDAEEGRTITSHQVEGWANFAWWLGAARRSDCPPPFPTMPMPQAWPSAFRGWPRAPRRLLYHRGQRHRRGAGDRRPRLRRRPRHRFGDRPFAARTSRPSIRTPPLSRPLAVSPLPPQGRHGCAGRRAARSGGR